MTAPTPMTIGRLARAAGVNIETIRYYQRIGLIKKPSRPPAGFRAYPAEVVTRIRFIKRAQALGFSLQDIAHLLELGDGHCSDVRQQAETKLVKIEAQIKDLQAMRRTLKHLVNECCDGQDNHPCPIIHSLADLP